MICASCGEATDAAPCASCGGEPLLDGHFRLEAELGKGASGTTFRAVDTRSGVAVAIKEIALGRGSSAKARELVEREAAVLSQLDHPGVPGFVQSGVVGKGCMPWTDDDEALAGRVREALPEPLPEKKMFGGLAFLERGHMALGVTKGRLMVRVGPDAHDEAMTRPGAAPMDFNGRAMRGMLFVTGDGLADLDRWVSDALTFSATLPAKEPKAPKAPKVRSKR